MTTLAIPYGFVTGRFVLAVGDTTDDVDRMPDAIPATGTVVLSPVATVHVLTAPAPITALPRPVTLTLDSEGYIVDPAGARGVWLIAGQYDAAFRFAGITHPSFRFEVTAAHTEAAPLDLTLAAPLVPSPATKFVVNEQVYQDTLAARDEAITAATPTDVQVFATVGTGFVWTKPAGVKTVHIIAIGGGGGGGGGRAQAATNEIIAGGGGGGGAGVSEALLPASAVGATLTVDVGPGGTGGAAAVGAGNASYGGVGGISQVKDGSKIILTGGRGQYGEGARPGSASLGGPSIGGIRPGSAGGDSPNTNTSPPYLTALGTLAGAGGGGGGNIMAFNDPQPGAQGGSSGSNYGGYGWGSLGAGFYGPADGISAPVGVPLGGGGGGGGTTVWGTPDPGGPGGRYGAGGGGGGSATVGNQGSAGGPGGQGIVIISAW